MERIRVKSRNGKLRYVKVDYVTDYINSTGDQFSVAYKGDTQYKVIERDFDGAVFAKAKK